MRLIGLLIRVLIFELAAVALPAAAVSEHGVRAGFRLPTTTKRRAAGCIAAAVAHRHRHRAVPFQDARQHSAAQKSQGGTGGRRKAHRTHGFVAGTSCSSVAVQRTRETQARNVRGLPLSLSARCVSLRLSLPGRQQSVARHHHHLVLVCCRLPNRAARFSSVQTMGQQASPPAATGCWLWPTAITLVQMQSPASLCPVRDSSSVRHCICRRSAAPTTDSHAVWPSIIPTDLRRCRTSSCAWQRPL